MKKNIVNFLNVSVGVKSLTISNLINAMTGFSFIFILTSKLGLDGFGVFSLLQGGVLIGCSIFNFKLWEPLISSFRKGSVARKFKTSLIFEMSVTFIGWWITTLIIATYNSVFLQYEIALFNILVLSSSVIWSSFSSQSAVIRYNSNYRVLIFANIIAGLMKLIPLFFLDLSIGSVCIIYSFSEFSRYSIIMYFSLNKIDIFRVSFSRRFLNFIFYRSFKLNLSSILDIPVNYLDRYIINHFIGPGFVGVYIISRRIASVISIFFNSYYQHIYLSIFKGAEKSLVSTVKYCLSLIIKSNVILIVIMVISLPIFQSFNSYYHFIDKELITLLFIVVYCSVFSYIANYLHPIFLYSQGYDFIVRITLLSNLSYVIILISSIKYYSLYGAAIALLAQSLIMNTLKLMQIKVFYDKKNKIVCL
ncbi:hypothetical protein I7096_003282 [Vibrio parahaemolyticus]|nr:hypothetical protein [Vibrio parahaemolyticus]EJE8512823.1 hypothetical protein [Vibrio parahaemolyticus]EJE8772766.1 hypothetical protein [Vibrio parahaemolyticus]ELA7161822.1 hypothetical protein [Vibrio parahaemolyticus]